MDALSWTRHGTCRSLIALALALCLAVFFPTLSFADPGDPGVAWLLSQQLGDGRVARGDDIVSPDHATTEVLRALHATAGLSGPWAEARSFVDGQERRGIPWSSRRLITAHLAGDDTEVLLEAVLRSQNPDGGFAAEPGEQSTVLDTADALEALGGLGLRDSAVLQPAIGFLLGQQRVDGAFAATRASPPSVYLTARALSALQRYQFEFGSPGAVQASIAFLESQRRAGGWGDSWERAQALLALVPTSADAGRYADALDALRAAQEPSGAWANSVYATALALRSLRLAAGVGGAATVRGRVVDAGLLAPIAGARVQVEGAVSSPMMTTDADGRFMLELDPPGPHALRLEAAGFVSLTREVEVFPWQVLDLGSVALTLPAGTALLAGQVTDAATGAAIPATVAASGGGHVTVTADAQGFYTLAVPAGAVDISVNAPGYREAQAATVLAPGNRIAFSPALSRDDVPESAAQVALRGRLLDADSGAPVSGAVVRVVDTGGFAVSGIDGEFELGDLTPGAVRLEVVHASYRTLRRDLLTTAGARIAMGDLLLQEIAGSVTSLMGQVTDSDSGGPVAGASIRVGDSYSESDADGRFRIEGIAEVDFEVRVGATGYRTVTRRLVLAQPGPARMDVALERTGHDGVQITGLVAHQESIGAFEEAWFSVMVENLAAGERQAVLSVAVEAIGGGFREDFVVTAPAGPRLPVFALAPGEVALRDFSWFTRELEPGLYRVRAQVWNADATMMLDERATLVEVTQTLQIATLGLMALPRELVRGERREVELSANVRNISNLPGELTFTLNLLAPSGEPVHQQDVRLEVPTSTAPLSFPLARFEHTFDQAGPYALELGAMSGPPVQVLETSRIDVAPNIRIEGAHHLEPTQVLPVEAARVRIRLTIEGREDGQ